MSTEANHPKILFLISEDWYFWSHRLPLAKAAKVRGWKVALVARFSNLTEQIQKQSINTIPLTFFTRSFRDPLRELRICWEIFRVYKREQPDIVHQVAWKPVVYGTLAARVAGVPSIVNALAGLGFLFTSDRMVVSIIKNIVIIVLRMLFSSKSIRLIVQNSDDLHLLIENNVITNDRISLIRGSGVDTDIFVAKSEKLGLPVVVLASRMLWDKGIKEFVEAARCINDGPKLARFVLVGIPDPENPSSIPESYLRDLHTEGVIEWWGYQSDMPSVFSKVHIVCLPSYREGLPKVLLEAAASGKPIVATDVTGCREIVRHGKNGLLVPVKNGKALAKAIHTLILDSQLRRSMGLRGREIVVQEFSQNRIVQETLALYDDLLAKHDI